MNPPAPVEAQAATPRPASEPPAPARPNPSDRNLRSVAATQARVRVPPMNGALAELVAAQAQEEARNPGLCHLCRQRAARSSCHGCAARVCLKDRWTMFGLCKRCLRPEDLRRWHQAGRIEATNWLAQG